MRKAGDICPDCGCELHPTSDGPLWCSLRCALEDAARDAYNEGFAEGMKEHTSHRGGNPWRDSKAKKKYVKEEAP